MPAPRQVSWVAVADEHALAAGLDRRAEVVHLDLRADAEHIEANSHRMRYAPVPRYGRKG
jgi:hypothetical protein